MRSFAWFGAMVGVNDSSPPHKAKVKNILDERKTDWKSIYVCVFMQFVTGIQISIYFMSMWPYLSRLDPSASLAFLGWVVASCSFGCSVANPLFGWWNQRTMAVTAPTICGFLLAALGQLFYALLPLFESNQKWIMMAARIVTGFGTGSIAVLRAYVATASAPTDRLRAISFSTAGWVLGISAGPALQAIFTPIGNGWKVGFIVLDMYTLPAFIMVIITLVSCPIMWFWLTETYAGIIDKNDQEANNVVIPKYNFWAAMCCVMAWICSSLVATNIEVLATPLATAIFGWNHSDSVFYNGIMQSLSCLISVCNYFVIGYTQVGKIDKRKQILFGLSVFIIYSLITLPWPFYPGPLKYIPAGNTSTEVGGCDPSYTWCSYTNGIPLTLYVVCFIVLQGYAFPFVGSPSASLYSEILGPRPQGFMQGIYSFGGSIAQFGGPVISTYLFEQSGYLWVVVVQLVILSSAVSSMLIFYRKLIPLELERLDGPK